jgi:rhamnogalacturonyl hydrolase YesR
MKKAFIIGLCFIATCLNSQAQIKYAKQMAATIMDQYRDSMVVMKYASHLEQDNLIQPGQTVEEAQKSRPANWNYEIGVVLMGFERLWTMTGDKTYYDYTKHIIDHFIIRMEPYGLM